MQVHFNIHYKTIFGEIIGIQYRYHNDDELHTLMFETYDGENWFGMTDIPENTTIFYAYVLKEKEAIKRKEWGNPRMLTIENNNIFIRDQWRPRDSVANAFLSTAFTKAILKRPAQKARPTSSVKHKNANHLTFELLSSTIDPGLVYGVIGNIPELGNWEKPVLMDETDFPLWKTTIELDQKNLHIEYKYIIANPKTSDIVLWEGGENRLIYGTLEVDKPVTYLVHDDQFHHDQVLWRGAGVAIPVFSLRTQKSMGIGEFTDLKMLTDWATTIGLKLIQVLPVNDTLATKTWADSYPYAAISVFALHPLYVNLPDIATFKDAKVRSAYLREVKKLNKLSHVDFEKVLSSKFKYLRLLFDQEYDHFVRDKGVTLFVNENKEWLQQYAAFCHLRDVYTTCNFNLWPKHATFSDEVIEELCDPKYPDYKEIEFYYFIQYHADRQLREARDYARNKQIVLKGDLPIGIYRYSCDAWVAPELYNMDGQAGAPPDVYSVLGQNWGFPTYNWEVMSKDEFAWWRNRMHQLSRYFDAMRIDHILGFFRIWQIPINQVEGTMGLFNPRIPIKKEELEHYGISGDLSRYTKPYITTELLNMSFGFDAEDIFKTFFSRDKVGNITFKSSFDDQLKIRQFVSQNPRFMKYEAALLRMISEVLLIEEPQTDGQYYNPRITLSSTYSFSQLETYMKDNLIRLYNDYYFSRHEAFWKEQALWKLPVILDASEMLICGEDLGMIPKSVPRVMQDLNIMSLEIQRMPKGQSKFGIVGKYPYFSVCSPSSHDMSTIRGWWQSNHEVASEFYYNYLHWSGYAPYECTTDIVRAVVHDHLASPSMLAIFPIQDLVGMDGELRYPIAEAEQINEPSNPKHYWKFRFHLNIEELLQANGLNGYIRDIISRSGR